MIRGFTAKDVGDQSGKTFLVTGANTGIGYETTKVLAARGGRVLMGCRDRAKAEDAAGRILEDVPDAVLEIVDVDLGDLASVRAAAEQVLSEPRLDVLVNNAGVMIPPYTLTKDGFELQMGVNHLGPFALTGLLLPLLERTPGARIVNTSSNAHRFGEPNFDDLHGERAYNAMDRYGASKLANLLHTHELDRRLQATGSDIISVAAHPGATDTDLVRHIPGWLVALFRPFMWLFLNPAPAGAWPTLAAATHPDVEAGQYFGPQGIGQIAGPARLVDSNDRAKDAALARRLWEVSVELTGVDPGI